MGVVHQDLDEAGGNIVTSEIASVATNGVDAVRDGETGASASEHA